MEAVTRQKTSKHNLRLGFKERWRPNSIKILTLHLFHKFGSGKLTKKATPIRLPMIVWDKNKQEIKEDYIEKYKEYLEWINAYKSKRPSILIDLYNSKINHLQAFDKILNIVKDGYILDKFEDFCKVKKRNRNNNLITNEAVRKHKTHIHALQTYFYSIGEIQYQRLMWSHIQLSTHHIDKIETLLEGNTDIKANTKNRYLESLNYASYVNPNTTDTQPFTNKYEEGDDSSLQVQKYLERKELSEGMLKIGNNLQWLEAYLFWLLSFSLRGIDGADICLMDKSWLVDERGKTIDPKDINHYIPNYYRLLNKYNLNSDPNLKDYKNILPERFNATDEKVYIRGYRKKTSSKKVGIRILFNHYPTLIIHKLLKHCISINRPHFLYKGDDPMKLYNFDYFSERGRGYWKNLQGTYTKQLKKMCGDNGKLKNTRHTFTTELSNIYGGNGAERLLSVSLGHRRKKLIEHYVNVPQSKMDILQIEVLKSYDINKVLKLLIRYCSNKKFEYKGKELALINTKGLSPIVNEYQIEALEIPLSYWSWRKEDEYQRLLKKENDRVFDDLDDNGNPIYKKIVYSHELKELIEERDKNIKEKHIKRKHTGYDRKTNKVTTTEY